MTASVSAPAARLKLVVAVGGASGSIYARRLLDALAALQARDPAALEVGLCFSSAGAEVWNHEIGAVPDYPFKRYGLRDFRAPFASGSAGWQAMVVIPCSTGGLARIAHGASEDLIGRAADVMLKERRRLVLVVRETPLSLIHLENMTAVTRAGAVVLPASPSFYSRPDSIDALLDTVVARVLDHVGLPQDLMPRWGEPAAKGAVR
ncbi:MAG TPA: UbiX family flavin prenyltransferase [Polyangia bacterium]|nr:UbiX family flavin prenyltransferase [Polyangia bacterium]